LAADPAGGQELIQLGPVGDTALLRYTLDYQIEANIDGSVPASRRTLHILQPRRHAGDSIIAMAALNPPIHGDEAASIFMLHFPAGIVITQDPVFITITDLYPFRDSAKQRYGAALTGYRRDSVFVLRNYPGSNHFDFLFLSTGTDATGNGRWEASAGHIASFDYDYDGTLEHFFYVFVGRDREPRTLFCVDMERMEIEWSLPVASSPTKDGVVNCRDSVNPGILVTTYGPDNHVSDANFSDEHGYLTRIDKHGQIVFNYELAPMFGGPRILPIPDDYHFILFHPQPLPGQVIGDSAAAWLSIVNGYGQPIKSVPIAEWLYSMDLAQVDDDPEFELLVIGQSGRIGIYDLDLRMTARSEPTPLTGYVTSLKLPGMADSAFLFSSRSRLLVYSREWTCLGAIPIPSEQLLPAAYDSSGAVTMVAISYGNGYSFGTFSERPIFQRLMVLVVRARFWLVGVLGLLALMLVVVNIRRNHAIQELARVQARNDALLNASPDLMFRISGDGTFLDYQAARGSELFAPGEQFLGKRATEILPQNLARRLMELIAITLQGGRIQSFEYQLSVGGRLQDFEARIVASGRDEVLAIVRNISDRKAGEAAIQRQAQILQQVSSAVIVTDLNGTITDFNKGAEEFTGYLALEVLNRDVAALFPQDDWAEVSARIQKGMQGSGWWHGEIRILTKRGVPLFMELTISALKDMTGQTIGWIGYGLDIHARKLAELALKDSEEKYRALATYSSQGILMMAGRRITNVNPRLAEIMEISAEELVGKSVDTVIRETSLPDETEFWLEYVRKRIDVEDEPMTAEADIRSYRGTYKRVEIYSSKFTVMGETVVQSTWQDITARYRAERALRESEVKYRELSEHTSIGVLQYDDERIHFANDQIARIAETTVEHLMSISTSELIAVLHGAESVPNHLQQIRNRLAGKDAPSRFDATIRTFAGSQKQLEALAVRIEREDRPLIQATWVDMTARHQAEVALRASEEKYRSLAEHANIGILQYDDERIYFANDQVAALTDTTAEHLMSMTSAELISALTGPEAAPAFMNQIRNRLIGIEAPSHFEADIKTFAGKHRRLEALAVRIETADRPLIQATWLDITARHKAEVALRESEAKFRAVAESMTAGITIFASDKLLYCNPASERITGYSQEELATMNFWDMIHPRFREMVLQRGRARLAGEDIPPRYEVMILRKDGESRWVDYSAKTIDFLGERAVLGTTIDITDAVKAKEELERVYLEQYHQVREIAGGVSHEIYNSLFPATSTLYKLKERIQSRANGDADGQRDLRLIGLAEQSIGRAIHMTDSVTKFSRLEANRKVEDVSVAEMVHEVIEQNRERLEELRIELKTTVVDGARVGCSRPHFFALLNNLVVNAIDALAEVEQRKLSITARLWQQYVQIQVSDSGPGISAENQSRVFTAFFSTKPRSGTGLGLAMVKKIAQMYGGAARMTSHVDMGTCFDILIPKAVPRAGVTDASQSDQS
ncbi:MAG: PAS domain S-box protein, partial [candidate division Zixibacteria bacterium]|nr:PAS domain S-box protein [candidate division Zixibacteria bacterium]